MTGTLLPVGLQDALKHHHVIPFIGAGVSKSIRTRNGGTLVFPDWIELLTRAAILVKSDGTAGTDRLVHALLCQNPPELLDAARRAQGAVPPSIWSGFLYEQFSVD